MRALIIKLIADEGVLPAHYKKLHAVISYNKFEINSASGYYCVTFFTSLGQALAIKEIEKDQGKTINPFTVALDFCSDQLFAKHIGDIASKKSSNELSLKESTSLGKAIILHNISQSISGNDFEINNQLTGNLGVIFDRNTGKFQPVDSKQQLKPAARKLVEQKPSDLDLPTSLITKSFVGHGVAATKSKSLFTEGSEISIRQQLYSQMQELNRAKKTTIKDLFQPEDLDSFPSAKEGSVEKTTNEILVEIKVAINAQRSLIVRELYFTYDPAVSGDDNIKQAEKMLQVFSPKMTINKEQRQSLLLETQINNTIKSVTASISQTDNKQLTIAKAWANFQGNPTCQSYAALTKALVKEKPGRVFGDKPRRQQISVLQKKVDGLFFAEYQMYQFAQGRMDEFTYLHRLEAVLAANKIAWYKKPFYGRKPWVTRLSAYVDELSKTIISDRKEWHDELYKNKTTRAKQSKDSTNEIVKSLYGSTIKKGKKPRQCTVKEAISQLPMTKVLRKKWAVFTRGKNPSSAFFSKYEERINIEAVKTKEMLAEADLRAPGSQRAL